MRLTEVYYTCKKILENWVEIECTSRMVGENYYYKITNAAPVAELLSTLYRVGAFADQINDIYKDIPSLRENNYIDDELSSTRKYRLDDAYEKLQQSVQAICKLCENMGIRVRAEGIDIKLPPTTSFSEISVYLSQLDKVLSQCPTLRDTGCVAEVQGTDVGSVWAIVGIVGASAFLFVKALTEIIDQCVVIRTHMAQAKKLEESARKQELENALLESMVAGMKKTVDGYVDKAVNDIATAHGYGEDKNEEREQIRFAINTLGELMSKGMEIHCAIGANEEVQELFPPIDNTPFLESVAKKLLTGGVTEE